MATALQYMKNGPRHSPPEFGEGVVKVVVIGEPRVGKTSFIRAFYDHHEPGEIESYNGVRWYECEFAINGEHGRASIFKIPDHPGFLKEQRTPHYEDAEVIVLMYAIDNPQSLKTLADNWIPEVSAVIDLDETPMVLVGNKNDLRDDEEVIARLALEDKKPVTYQQGEYLFTSRGLKDFREISTKSLEEVNATFDLIFNIALN